MTNAAQTKTTAIVGFSRAQITPDLVERARARSIARGTTQFGFCVASGQPCHTIIVTRGGTIENPTGARGEA